MPYLEVTLPKLALGMRCLMAASLTTAFSCASGWESDIIGIKFNEYDLAEAAVGGRLCTDMEAVPYLH
ncbi:MAG: hypothetical protein Q8N36_01280, partial [bacterium]|nr:hypothetical protein [bacterium]